MTCQTFASSQVKEKPPKLAARRVCIATARGQFWFNETESGLRVETADQYLMILPSATNCVYLTEEHRP